MMYAKGMFNSGGCFGYGHMMGGWSWLIGIGILLIIVAVTYLIVKKGKNRNLNNNALETLRVKYAQGEITEEVYKHRKSVLEDNK